MKALPEDKHILAALIGGVTAGAIALGNYKAQVNENRRIREREDNAIQRRVADMRAAGISPTLAAGNAAAATRTKAPKTDPMVGMAMAKAGAEIAEIKSRTRRNNEESDTIAGVRDSEITIKKEEAYAAEVRHVYQETLARYEKISGLEKNRILIAESKKAMMEAHITEAEWNTIQDYTTGNFPKDKRIMLALAAAETAKDIRVHDKKLYQKYALASNWGMPMLSKQANVIIQLLKLLEAKSGPWTGPAVPLRTY